MSRRGRRRWIGGIGQRTRRDHVRLPRHGRLQHIAERRARGLHPTEKELQAQRPKPVAVVTVIKRVEPARAAIRQTLTSPKLIEPLLRPLVNQLDLRPVLLRQRHSRLTGTDLSSEQFIERIQIRFRQVHDLRQIQSVELFQVVTQRRIHLGLTAERLEHIGIAHAFLPGEFHREQQQRRMNALLGRLL